MLFGLSTSYFVKVESTGEIDNETGLERAENLAKDLEWFKEQGQSGSLNFIICPRSTVLFISKNCQRKTRKRSSATSITRTLGTLQVVAAKILNNRGLEFYKRDGDLSGVAELVILEEPE
ncbi:hypothetical protein L6452_27500 [Arctium lappa]|uniref:Uncharacterized protein n=1 Tax=Arctium lappa TaxID=4217 RepID=A0ACB8ZX68_ARCLA|nr:hypothetical protein L6452_27500 [Arctium lappa]